MDKTTLGQRLLAIRTEANLTQQAFAEAIGVTRQTVTRWETGTRSPDLLQLEAIAAAIEKTPSQVAEKIFPKKKK
jgi:transcriptional regulator with XRE-family HTH domain